jgi:alpha/beta superfamily hydrolase
MGAAREDATLRSFVGLNCALLRMTARRVGTELGTTGRGAGTREELM